LSQIKSFYDFDLPSLEAYFKELGQKPFRARQAFVRVYKKGVRSWSEMTEFSASLQALLEEHLSLATPKIITRQVSRDGTVKLLLELADGERIETVLMPDEERLTQCVSTQVGCAMGCKFCRTAESGLTRHLTAGEIVGQVILAGDEGGADGSDGSEGSDGSDASGGSGSRVTNVVFMGMGEPLHNFDATVRAFAILSSDHGLTMSKRRMTVSTSGLVDAMKKLPEDMVEHLAISLNATTDEVRDEVMPINRRYPIAELIGTLKEMSGKKRARVTIEYVMLGGVNDSLEDAKRLVRLLSGFKNKVNLIPFNPHGDSKFKAPTAEAVRAFQQYLMDKNCLAMIRKSRGDDILAACGQLKADDKKDTEGDN
jgi:23S rRNA (adenine2503-C2)-methyltransferase